MDLKFENGIGMRFALIHPGEFIMGSPPDEPQRSRLEVPHKVILTYSFYMQSTPVTKGQWREFVNDIGYKTKAEMGDGATGWTGSEWVRDKRFYWDNPGFCQDESHPVTCVSMDDVEEFLKWLNHRENKKYRLPLEAEWEYACRAGTKTPFFFGRYLYSDQANVYVKDPVFSCQIGVYRDRTTPVASFPPNAWGLYDMHGNVKEWCRDWFGYYPNTIVVNPIGPEFGKFGIIRGGCWNCQFDDNDCRSASRGFVSPLFASGYVGFRVMMSENHDIERSYCGIAILKLPVGDKETIKSFQKKRVKIKKIIEEHKVRLHQLDEDLERYLKREEILRKTGDRARLGQTYQDIGRIYFDRAERDKSLEYYLKSTDFRRDVEDRAGLGQTYKDIGLIYYYKSECDKALEYFFSSEEILGDVKDKAGLSLIYCLIGDTYKKKGERDQALEYYLKSAKILRETGDKFRLAHRYLTIARCYFSQRDRRAKDYADQAIKVFLEADDNEGLGNALKKRKAIEDRLPDFFDVDETDEREFSGYDT